MQKEITDYKANAEMKAFAQEEAAAKAAPGRRRIGRRHQFLIESPQLQVGCQRVQPPIDALTVSPAPTAP